MKQFKTINQNKADIEIGYKQEIKLEEVFNDDKKENIKKFIDEIENSSEPNQALIDAAERLQKDKLGFEESDLKSVNMKLALSSKYIIMEAPKHSELCEHIAKEFSYNELLFIVTLFVTEKTSKILDQNPEVLATMQLKALLDQLKNEEEL